MRIFEDVLAEKKLVKFLASSVGMLFYGDAGGDRVIVRKFSCAKDALIYVSISSFFFDWVRSGVVVPAHVAFQPYLEVGKDFIMRRHGIYTSTSELLDEESTVEIPDEYRRALSVVEGSLSGALYGNQSVIENVVRNSVLLPTGKTCYDFSSGKILVFEPKITLDDMNKWIM